jgi:hypothetical protein
MSLQHWQFDEPRECGQKLCLYNISPRSNHQKSEPVGLHGVQAAEIQHANAIHEYFNGIPSGAMRFARLCNHGSLRPSEASN